MKKDIYSALLKTIVLPVADKVMKTQIASSYKKIKQMQGYSSDEIQHWQSKRLFKLLEHAYKHTKYYSRLFDNIGMLPNDFKSIEDLKYFPILSKEMIRENFNDLICDNIDSFPYIETATGGSSGDPLIFFLDHLSWSMTNANNIINWENLGYKYGDRYISLGSSTLLVDSKKTIKHQIYYRLKNKIGLNGVNMSDQVCKNYIALIKKRRIHYVYGYASSIYLLAKYALINNEHLEIHACFPTSEVLTDQFRKTIQKSFKCEILNCYGANDGGISAFSQRSRFFEVGYNCLVRIENPDENNIGPAIITDLFSYAMPLINYNLGDKIQIDVSMERRQSYNGQIINNVFGRTSDIIQLENGHILTGPGFTVLFKDIPVEHYCIEKIGINSINCSIVKLPHYSQSHENIIRSTFLKHMGPNTSLKLLYTNEISLTKNGKRQYFKA
jgi:phenylacetate-CoA ligase